MMTVLAFVLLPDDAVVLPAELLYRADGSHEILIKQMHSWKGLGLVLKSQYVGAHS